MGFAKIIRELIDRRFAALCTAMLMLAAMSVPGCAAVCALGGSSGASKKVATAHSSKAEGATHRPPMPFPEEPGDDSESAAPQVVNVFGEVNGNPPRAATLSGEVALQQHTFTDEGYDSDVAVDPTGKWLAFSSTRNSEHPSIYMQRVDGTAVTQFTDGGSDDAYPSFSPDGKQIAFSSTRSGNWQLYVMDMDGRNITQLTSGIMQCVHPSYSPDGGRLVYCSLGSRSGQWELWTLDLKTAEKRMIGYGLFPSWSPDKSADRIAFQRARQRGSRWFSLWTIDLVDGEGRRATEVAVSANAAILSPSWSPSGKRLVFATIVQPGKGGEKRSHGQTDIWTIGADGSGRQRLTDGRASNTMPFWASDQRVYFISNRGGAESVWSVRTETARQLTAEAAAPKKGAGAIGSTDTGEEGTR